MMSRREKRKKGISLVGFAIFLIILVCLEGIYIVKLRNKPNSTNISNSKVNQEQQNQDKKESEDVSQIDNQENTDNMQDSYSEKIFMALGIDGNLLIDDILNTIEAQAELGNIVKFENELASEDSIPVQDIQNSRENYKIIIKANLDNQDFLRTIKFESGKLFCEYNAKNILNILGLESKNYSEFGANENNIKIYEFNIITE